MISITTLIIVCPLLALAGFIDSIAGGGGLISLPAYVFAGLPMHEAIATNKLSSTMGTTVSAFKYWREGYFKPKLCLAGIAGAIIGSFAGSNLSIYLEERILKIMILFVLPVVAFYVLKKKDMGEGSGKEPFSVRKTAVLTFFVAIVLGIYDGLYGPGTGTFLILLFSGLCRMSIQDSQGTCKAINLATNATALVVFFVHAKVLIPLGLIAGVSNMLGNYIGSRAFTKKGGAKFVRPLILINCIIFFIKICIEVF